MRTQVQLLALLITLVVTVDDTCRPSLVPPEAWGAEARGARPGQEEAESSAAEAAIGSVSDQKQTDLEGVSDRAPGPRHELTQSVKRRVAGAIVHLPRGFWTSDEGEYDLIVHFHGGSLIVEPQFDAANLNAVLATVNLGVGSRVYTDRFSPPRALEHLLAAIDGMVRQHGPAGKSRLRHLALSSWSAGYGAIQSILAHRHNLERIDAVLLADGMHGVFADARQRRVADRVMAPFVRFARTAVEDGKLMLVTHSAVQTYDYASTTETARYLVDALSLGQCSDAAEPGDMSSSGCHHDRGVRVVGYGGDDAGAHSQHLLHMDELMLAPLKARWHHGAVS